MLISIGRGPARPLNYSIHIPSLRDVLASCVYDLDATQVASYPGTGQTWRNLVASPSDSATQTSYDFYLGATSSATTDDPTFNGTAGAASAYFSFDGGDYFDAVSMPTTTLLRNLHRTDSSRPVTFGFAFRTPGMLTQSRLISTANSSANHGISFRMNTNGSVDCLQSNASGSFDQKSVLPNGSLIANTDYLLLIALNAGSTGGEKRWLNTSTSSAWNASFAPLTGSTNASGACIGAQTGHANALGNGTRLYGVYLFNEILDNTKAASVIAALNTRHGRTYA